MGRPATVALLVGAGACYAPAVREGAPCGPGDVCPTGLACDLPSSRCLRVAPGDADLDALGDPDASMPALDASTPDGGVADFVDTFSRPDGAPIGNGWIEKTPATFSLSGGEVTRVDSDPLSYRDNLVYRPASENVRDVEVSVRVRFTALPPRFPQVFVRGQTATIDAAGSFAGYMLYVDGTLALDRLVLGRQRGTAFVSTLSPFTLSEPLTPLGRYRFTLRATGAAPVALTARVEKLAGSTWVVIGSTTASDTAAERISDAGSVGFSGDEQPPYVYDEFRRTAL